MIKNLSISLKFENGVFSSFACLLEKLFNKAKMTLNYRIKVIVKFVLSIEIIRVWVLKFFLIQV